MSTTCRTPMPVPPSKSGGHWYRQPVLWLGIAVFVASMLGCAWIIMAGARSADTPLQTSRTVFGVPATTHDPRAADTP